MIAELNYPSDEARYPVCPKRPSVIYTGKQGRILRGPPLAGLESGFRCLSHFEYQSTR